MTTESDKKAEFDKIVRETDGMTQEQRWQYYDKHPGSQQIVWEFRHRNIIKDSVSDFYSAVDALGVYEEVEVIDRATEGLSPDDYIRWLDEHPSAKQTLVEINKVVDAAKLGRSNLQNE